MTKPRTARRDVVGYIRVSTEEQALGPEAQRAAIERWAAARGYTLAAVFEDRGVSGGAALDRRPGLLAAPAELRRRRAVYLVAVRPARAGHRRRRDDRADGRACRCGGGDDGRCGRGHHARGRDAAAHRRCVRRLRARRDPRPHGRRWPPSASAANESAASRPTAPRSTPQPAELAALRCAGELAAAGVPLRRIGAELERAGHRPRGRAWHLTTVARLVRRAQAGFEGSKAA